MILAALVLAAQQPDLNSQMAAATQARDRWQTCTAQSMHKYALTTKEPAASVVEAAIGECSSDFAAVQNSLVGAFGPDGAERTINLLLDSWRPQLTAGVFRLRSAPHKK